MKYEKKEVMNSLVWVDNVDIIYLPICFDLIDCPENNGRIPMKLLKDS